MRFSGVGFSGFNWNPHGVRLSGDCLPAVDDCAKSPSGVYGYWGGAGDGIYDDESGRHAGIIAQPKALRGLTNTTLGWTMMFIAPVKWWNDEVVSTPGWPSPKLGAFGFMFGVPIGILETGRWEVWGIVELLTFPVPWPKATYDSPYGARGEFPWDYHSL